MVLANTQLLLKNRISRKNLTNYRQIKLASQELFFWQHTLNKSSMNLDVLKEGIQ